MRSVQGRVSSGVESVECGAVLEALEPRLLLSASLVIGDTAGAAAKSLVYYDWDGTQVTVSLTKGSATLTFGDDIDGWTTYAAKVATLAGNHDIGSVDLMGTNAASVLTFKTAIAGHHAFDDSFVTDLYAGIEGITGTGVGIGQILAGNINLNGSGIKIDGGASVCKVHDVGEEASLAFGGLASQSMTFEAHNVQADGLTFAGTLSAVTVTDWTLVSYQGDEPGIKAAAVGTVTVKGGELWIGITATTGDIGNVTITTVPSSIVAHGGLEGSLTAAGSIGNIAITGGDLYGSLTATNGNIGNITVTGVAAFEKDPDDPRLGQGCVIGGNIYIDVIRTNAVKGKSIGNITVTGGTLSADIYTIDKDGNPVVGDIGNIVCKSLHYKASVDEEEVLDAQGYTVYDRNGDAVTHIVTSYDDLGASIQVTLSMGGKLGNITCDCGPDNYGGQGVSIDGTAGSVGNIAIIGGGLYGTLTAAGRIGNISIAGGDINGWLTTEGGGIGNITVKGGQDGVISGTITSAGSVGNVTVTAADILGDIIATGKIGNITVTGGNIGAISQYSVDDATITADGGIGNMTVTGGDLVATVRASDAGVGNITVTGGNLLGDIIVAGTIGNITVTGVGMFNRYTDYSQYGVGYVAGGNMCGRLVARGVKGKAIGNITLTGGEMGVEDLAELIAAGTMDENDDTVTTLAGDIGNIVVKILRYKVSVLPEDIGYGQEPTGSVTTYSYQGGGIYANVDTLGKLGNLTTCGGDLAGDIHAAGGMGDVNVASILLKQMGVTMGIPYADTEEDLLAGNMTASLRAEPGANAVGVKSITVTGGDVEGDVAVTGKVGNVTIKGLGVYYNGWVEFNGGTLSSDSFHATSIGNIALVGLGLWGNVLADNSIGAVSLVCGDFSGTVTATAGSVGNISIKQVTDPLVATGYVRLYGSVTAGDSIGNVSVEGGDISGSLTAQNAIGNISFKTLTNDAWAKWSSARDDYGDMQWSYDSGEGYAYGTDFELTIALGGSGASLNTSAKLGTISSAGAAVTLHGTVSFDPAKVKVTVTPVTYVSDAEPEEVKNASGDVTGHKVTNTTTTLPGEDDLTTYVHKQDLKQAS